jgi:hypothetical protein
MVQIVKKIIFTKPDPLNSMSKNFQNYGQFRKMHKFRTTPTQAKTRCDNSKTTLKHAYFTLLKVTPRKKSKKISAYAIFKKVSK